MNTFAKYLNVTKYLITIFLLMSSVDVRGQNTCSNGNTLDITLEDILSDAARKVVYNSAVKNLHKYEEYDYQSVEGSAGVQIISPNRAFVRYEGALIFFNTVIEKKCDKGSIRYKVKFMSDPLSRGWEFNQIYFSEFEWERHAIGYGDIRKGFRVKNYAYDEGKWEEVLLNVFVTH